MSFLADWQDRSNRSIRSNEDCHWRAKHWRAKQFGQKNRAIWQNGLALTIALLTLPVVSLSALAAKPNSQTSFPPNPLEISGPDPLLPEMAVDRPLSPQEKAVLNSALDELQAQAEAKLRAGDIPGAFDLWNRELRLRRYLSPQEEVAALGRVGEVAWRESQVTELRVITQRLQEIQKDVQAQPQVNYNLLLTIAQTYQKVRAHDQAVALYQTLRTQAQQQKDINREQQILTALAESYLSWFDYPNAATSYQELLKLAKAQNDRTNELEYLKKLAYIYQQNNQPEQAIAVQQRLVDIYKNQQNFAPIPALKLAMGDSYVALNRPDQAAPSYQEAFATARSVQQYAYAADALQRLADLYRSLDRPNDALVVYQLLLDVEKQSYNTIGMIDTYDQIGQTHKAQGNEAQALAAFRQGLNLAQQLNYKVNYFNTQIREVNK
jgi:tetratricopeptide (TPR) repeat protein